MSTASAQSDPPSSSLPPDRLDAIDEPFSAGFMAEPSAPVIVRVAEGLRRSVLERTEHV